MLICKIIFHKKLEIGSVKCEFVTIFYNILEFSNPKQTHIELNLARNVADFCVNVQKEHYRTR